MAGGAVSSVLTDHDAYPRRRAVMPWASVGGARRSRRTGGRRRSPARWAAMRGTMTAYRIVAWGEPPQLTEVPVPEPGAGEVLVEVAGNGLCHSDLTMAQMPASVAEALGWQLPFTLGHEVGGRIVALGPGVTGFGEGEAVALVSPASCGTCAACRRGHDSACGRGLAGRGYGRDGGLARHVLAAELGAHEVAEEVDEVGGAEVVLDFVGVDATIAAGIAAVRPYGAFGLVGSNGGTLRRPWFGGLPRDAEVFTFQGSSIADVLAVVALAEAGVIRSEVDLFPLSRVGEAYAALDGGTLRGRAVVLPDI